MICGPQRPILEGMKAIAVAMILLAGCQLPDFDDYQNKVYNIPPIDYGTADVEHIARWVADWVQYTSDREHYGEREEWATPEQTYWARRGDCEDYALLLMYLVHRDTGIESRMIVGKAYGYGHAWVQVGADWWEATAGCRIVNRARYKKDYSLDYADAIGIAAERRSLSNVVIDWESPRRPSPEGR